EETALGVRPVRVPESGTDDFRERWVGVDEERGERVLDDASDWQPAAEGVPDALETVGRRDPDELVRPVRDGHLTDLQRHGQWNRARVARDVLDRGQARQAGSGGLAVPGELAVHRAAVTRGVSVDPRTSMLMLTTPTRGGSSGFRSREVTMRLAKREI